MAAFPRYWAGLPVRYPEGPPPEGPDFGIIELVGDFLGTENVGPFLATHAQAELVIGLRSVRVVEEDKDDADES